MIYDCNIIYFFYKIRKVIRNIFINILGYDIRLKVMRWRCVCKLYEMDRDVKENEGYLVELVVG